MKSSSPVDIEGIYNSYLESENEKNRKKRYDGNEHWYHASGAGSCSRKLYFESVLKEEPTNDLKNRNRRVLRLGTIVHNDFDKAFNLYNKQVYKQVNSTSKNKEKNNKKEIKDLKFHVEEEITINELNVRGFYDLVAEDGREEGSPIYLYDLKTSAAYSWKLKFGRNSPFQNQGIFYELQIGTYGYAVKEKFGRLDGMYLYYYKKDDSVMKCVPVPLTYVSRAYLFWKNIKDEHKQGLPQFRDGISPVQKWQCNYCQFLDLCKPPHKE